MPGERGFPGFFCTQKLGQVYISDAEVIGGARWSKQHERRIAVICPSQDSGCVVVPTNPVGGTYRADSVRNVVQFAYSP